MKSIFKAYSKDVNGITMYFVKKFAVYLEYKDLPPVLEKFGMHQDFLKACELADVIEEADILELMDELRLIMVDGKAIPVQQAEREKYTKSSNIFRLPHQWLARLGWVRI